MDDMSQSSDGSGDTFDLTQILERFQEEESSDATGEEGSAPGADESQEPQTEETDALDADTPDALEDEEQDEAEIEQDEEEESESEESEDDPEAEEAEQPETDPRDEQIASLTRMVQEQQAALRKLLDITETQRQAPQAYVPGPDPVDEEAVRLALFGSEADAATWEKFDSQTRDRARKVAQDFARREAQRAANPEAYLQQEVLPKVLDEIGRYLQPVLKDYHQRQVDTAVREHVFAKGLDSAEDRARIAEIMGTLPGADNPNLSLSDHVKLLQAASEFRALEKKQQTIKEKERVVRMRDKQQKAAKAARRRAASPERSKAQRSVPKDQAPLPTPFGQGLVDLFERKLSEQK